MYRDIASFAVATLACSTDVCECDRLQCRAAADQNNGQLGQEQVVPQTSISERDFRMKLECSTVWQSRDVG